MASGVNCGGTGGGDGGACWTGGGGRPWPGAVPGVGKIGAESEAVAPAESEAVMPGDEAAAVVAVAAELEAAKTWSKPGYLIPNW